MATLTLEQILQRVGGYVDQDTTTPTGTDLTSRTNYVNRAYNEWASSYDWEQLTEVTSLATAGVSNVSFGLPSNYRKPMSAVNYYSAAVPEQYTIIPRNERFDVNRWSNYNDNKVAWVDGDPANGFSITTYKGFVSGASLVMDIQVYPTSLISLTDQPVIDDPEYLVDRAIAYVLEARSDSRFPTMLANANQKLQTMLERQNAGNKGKKNTIPMDVSFSIGFD